EPDRDTELEEPGDEEVTLSADPERQGHEQRVERRPRRKLVDAHPVQDAQGGTLVLDRVREEKAVPEREDVRQAEDGAEPDPAPRRVQAALEPLPELAHAPAPGRGLAPPGASAPAAKPRRPGNSVTTANQRSEKTAPVAAPTPNGENTAPLPCSRRPTPPNATGRLPRTGTTGRPSTSLGDTPGERSRRSNHAAPAVNR